MVHAKECSVTQMLNVDETHPKVVDSARAKMAGKEMGELVSVGSIHMLPLRFLFSVCLFLFRFASRNGVTPESLPLCINSRFSIYPWPHFQNESWCSSSHLIISFHSHTY